MTLNIDKSHSGDNRTNVLCDTKLRAYMEKTHVRPYSCQSCRETKDATHFFCTHGMKCCTLFVAEKRCPRNEYSAPGVYRSECQLAPHPGVPQPLNSDRQSTRGQCPNTGRFAHLATGESISQPQISDCQFTPGHCPSADHCVILTVRILSRPTGFRLNQFMDI